MQTENASDPSLTYTPEVARLTAPIYERIRNVIPEIEWPVHAPYVAAINRLKAERNAIVMAHNYQTPEIFHGVGDFTGDSLALARKAIETKAEVIVMCGVNFMAETAKILNPEKRVLIPDLEAGCSLAASITAEDVRLLKDRYPGVPVVTYVNTTAAVKAECDICCTSSNALKVVESLDADTVIVLPAEYLAHWVARKTDVKIISWKGRCEVHERFTAEELRQYRESIPGVIILAHPECPPDVLREADFVGSTAGMIKHVKTERPARVVMLTECSMSDNVAVECPDVEFTRPCNLCPHMKTITLPKILRSLREMVYEIELDRELAERARLAVERMVRVG